MKSVRGVVTAVQEGRFRLVAEDGKVLSFVLSHRAAAEPQDLPQLQEGAARVRVQYSDAPHLIAAVAHRIEIEEKRA
ncbi:MAG: hypothetical protein ACM3JG_07365 [Thiohalocapsa sp.]